MLNRATIVGRITKELELRTSSNGKQFVGFTVAVNDDFNRDITNFISCFAWNQSAVNMCKYLSKGSLIAVDGRISTSNRNGSYSTFITASSVTFLESKNQSHRSNNFGDEQMNNIAESESKKKFGTDSKSSLNSDAIKILDDAFDEKKEEPLWDN